MTEIPKDQSDYEACYNALIDAETWVFYCKAERDRLKRAKTVLAFVSLLSLLVLGFFATQGLPQDHWSWQAFALGVGLLGVLVQAYDITYAPGDEAADFGQGVERWVPIATDWDELFRDYRRDGYTEDVAKRLARMHTRHSGASRQSMTSLDWNKDAMDRARLDVLQVHNIPAAGNDSPEGLPLLEAPDPIGDLAADQEEARLRSRQASRARE